MFSWKEFEKTKVLLSQDPSYVDSSGQHHITIRPVNLLRWMEMAGEDLGFLTLVEIAGVDLTEISSNEFDFELTYHLLNMGTHQRLNLHVVFFATDIVPSIVSLFSNADWMEREQWEALGIRFNQPMMSLLLPNGQKNFPLRKSRLVLDWPKDEEVVLPQVRRNPNKSEAPYPEEAYEWKEFDLFSQNSLGLFEWFVCFNPKKVVNSKLNIGFYHQGLEKLLENKDWQLALQLVDKINIGAAPSYSIAWAKVMEDTLRIKIPERAQAIRIVFLELARISEHLTVMHEITFALKLEENLLFLNAREKIDELVEKYCGRRQGLGIARYGGVKDDLPHGWIVEYQTVCEVVSKALRIIHNSLIGQKVFRENLKGAEVSAQTALQWGVSGPAMRASGLNFDLRKSQPFYFYQDIDFDIPIGIHGTAYERYLVRYEEILQSFRIVTQVIDNLPMGEIINADFDKGFLGVKDVFEKSELNLRWQYTGLESPNGEAGFLVMMNGSSMPYRVKIKTPSFPLAQALPHFILDIREEQLKACLASLGIRQSELDR
jgi:NADH-quinone oxidoreductase subunit C/D